MTGHRVVDARGDAALLEEGSEVIALARAHHVEMIDVPRPRGLRGQREGQAGEAGRIARGERAPRIVHGVEAAQKDAAHRGLEIVEAQIEADLHVYVLVLPSMVAKPSAPCGDLVVVGDEEAAVAHHGEILRRIEGKGSRAAEGADLLALPGRPVRL